MKATKDHISLKTAKLLKDCGVESEYLFDNMENIYTNEMPRIRLSDNTKHDGTTIGYFYPTYTWQEILWEHPKEFFGEECEVCNGKGYTYRQIVNDRNQTCTVGKYWSQCNNCWGITKSCIVNQINVLLKQNKYIQADLYFREHCILIKETL